MLKTKNLDKILLNKITHEHLIDFIMGCVSELDEIYEESDLNSLLPIYSNCIYINNEDLSNWSNNIIIYNEQGEILIEIEDSFINGYSELDYRDNQDLLIELCEQVKTLLDVEKLVIFN